MSFVNLSGAKNISIILLTMLCLVFGYRIFDLGITLTYIEDSLSQQRIETDTIEKFQRSSCASAFEKTSKANVFYKDNFLFINGVRFECKRSKNATDGVLYFSEEHRG